jgi:uncharacterized protein YyaL (SSP411 family)
MPRPAFTVLTGSVVALVVLAFSSRILKPWIPKPAENQLAGDDLEFFNRAASQNIDWHKPTAESFAYARRVGLPILLFVGSSHSGFSRALDVGAFTRPRVQAYLARNFVCIRADMDATPEYRSALLPISRYSAGILPECQMWVLEPTGKIDSILPQFIPFFPDDENAMTDALIRARDQFEAKTSAQDSAYEVAQERDENLILNPQRTASPGFDRFLSSLAAQIDPINGGFGSNGPKFLTPEAWRLQLLLGDRTNLESTMLPVLASSVVDLIDGGFFQGSRDEKWRQILFDKSAATNAALLRVLTQDAVVNQRDLSHYLAIRTFDSLQTEFIGPLGIGLGRPGDVDQTGRSARSSFPVRKLRELLSDDVDRTWAQIHLGLMVETNPTMAPRLVRFSSSYNDRLSGILAKLRAGAGSLPPTNGQGLCNVTGFVVARLIEGALALGDMKRLSQAVDLFSFVESFRDGPSIYHSNLPGLRIAGLSDYLSYCDAAIQHYRATGRNASFRSAVDLFLKALVSFEAKPGILRMSTVPLAPTPSFVGLPEVSDCPNESETARAIRIGQDLCRMLGSNSPSESRIRKFLNAAINNFTSLADQAGIAGSGFFAASASVFDDAYFVAVGKNAQIDSDELAKRCPTRLSFPAFGDVRADIQSRGTGVFVVRGEAIEGPFLAAKALQKVSPILMGGS